MEREVPFPVVPAFRDGVEEPDDDVGGRPPPYTSSDHSKSSMSTREGSRIVANSSADSGSISS